MYSCEYVAGWQIIRRAHMKINKCPQCIMRLNWMQQKKSKVLKFKLPPWNEHLKCYVLQESDIKINITWDYTSLLDKYHLYAQISVWIKCPKIYFQKKSEIINKKISSFELRIRQHIRSSFRMRNSWGHLLTPILAYPKMCENIYTILNKMV